MKDQLLVIVGVVSAYWAVSITMVFVNKRLVSGERMHSDISILLVWLQNLIGVFILLALRSLAVIFPPWSDLPRLHVQTLLRTDMLMASATYTAMLISNNLMLRHISVSFYQIARSLTLIFVIVLSCVILRERIVLKVIIPCVLITSGFCVGVKEEISFYGVQTLDVLYGVTTSFFAALSGIFCKRLQMSQGITSLVFTYYNFVISSVALTPVVLYTSQIPDLIFSPEMLDLTFWVLLVLSGAAGLAMGWVSTLQISLTSPLTHIVSTNAKSVFQILLAVVWNAERRSLFWWAGNGLVVGGVLLYALIKLQKEKQKRVVVRKPTEIAKISANKNRKNLLFKLLGIHSMYKLQ